MVVTKEILDELTERAKESPRLRCNMDLRNSADDQSQRMLNAFLGTDIKTLLRRAFAFVGILKNISMMNAETSQIP